MTAWQRDELLSFVNKIESLNITPNDVFVDGDKCPSSFNKNYFVEFSDDSKTSLYFVYAICKCLLNKRTNLVLCTGKDIDSAKIFFKNGSNITVNPNFNKEKK